MLNSYYLMNDDNTCTIEAAKRMLHMRCDTTAKACLQYWLEFDNEALGLKDLVHLADYYSLKHEDHFKPLSDPRISGYEVSGTLWQNISKLARSNFSDNNAVYAIYVSNHLPELTGDLKKGRAIISGERILVSYNTDSIGPLAHTDFHSIAEKFKLLMSLYNISPKSYNVNTWSECIELVNEGAFDIFSSLSFAYQQVIKNFKDTTQHAPTSNHPSP